MAETVTTGWRLAAAVAAVLTLGACADEEGAPSADADDAAAMETAEAAPEATEAEATPAPAPVLEIAGARQWGGPLSAVAVDLTMTARDQRAWDILWQLIGQPQPGPLPGGAMAVAVFLQGRDAAGFSVDIADVTAAGDGVAVTFQEVAPAGSPPPAGVGAPYVVRLVPLADGPVTFREG